MASYDRCRPHACVVHVFSKEDCMLAHIVSTSLSSVMLYFAVCRHRRR